MGFFCHKIEWESRRVGSIFWGVERDRNTTSIILVYTARDIGSVDTNVRGVPVSTYRN